MRLLEVVEILNSKQIKIQDLANQFGVSKDLLADILKDNGYKFNNKSKLREYVGEGTPADIELEPIIEERKSAKGKRKGTLKSNNSTKMVREKSDKNQIEVKQNNDLNLTENEIKFIKKLAKGWTDWDEVFELKYEFSQLRLKEKTKKASYEINETVYDEFDEFAERVGKPRNMSRNVMVEMALQRFMREFG